MERIEPPKGYILSNKESAKEILAVEAELLRSEGIDPRWPGFRKAEQDPDEQK